MLKGPPSLAGVRCRSAGGGKAEQGGGARETCLDCMSPQPTRQCKADVAYSSHTRQQHSRHSRSLSTPSKAVTRGSVSTRDCCMRRPARRRCSLGCTVGCCCDGCCGLAGCQKLLSSALNTCSGKRGQQRPHSHVQFGKSSSRPWQPLAHDTQLLRHYQRAVKHARHQRSPSAHTRHQCACPAALPVHRAPCRRWRRAGSAPGAPGPRP